RAQAPPARAPAHRLRRRPAGHPGRPGPSRAGRRTRPRARTARARRGPAPAGRRRPADPGRLPARRRLGPAPGRGGPGRLRPGRGGPGRGRPGVPPCRRPPPVDRRVPTARRALPQPRLRAGGGPGHMTVDDLAVLAIPAVLVTGLVLLGLGLDGRARDARRLRPWVGRFRGRSPRAGVRGARPGHVVAVCGGSGLAAGVAVLPLPRSPWLGLAFAGLA